ncbi:MAG: phospholipase [Alphaproteobacteria bacterium]|nr:phospholipase [Alphaproteobacteria bacterium]
MDRREADALIAVLQPLVRAFEVLFLVARHFHPPRFASLMAQIGTPDEDLKAARAQHDEALAGFGDIKRALDASSDAALRSYAALREVLEGGGDVRGVIRAFRFVAQGLEALYPLADVLPPVNRFFLDPAVRSDTALAESFMRPHAHERVGVMHFAAEEAEADGERGGFWLYVPETYSPDRASPLVMALHGGSGTGRQFLWSWLRDARSRGAILVAPSSVGSTWALVGDDDDTPNLLRMLDYIRSNWTVDPERLLLTGMSDGGTFTYVSGLEAGSPFTHLAPVSAAFHPLLAQMIDGERVRDLPIHIVHGALDWMFPATMAREAKRALSAAGADVTYREIDNLSHTYPREMNAAMLAWLAG